jgi:hypothetical protein
MKIFQNLSIRSKLVIATVIPMIALLYYLQINIRQELRNKEAALQVKLDLAEIEKVRALIHELQIERALIVGFSTFNGTRGREEMYAQRESTNEAARELTSFLGENGLVIPNLWIIDSLPGFRAKAEALQFDEAVNGRYQAGKSILLEENAKILRRSQNDNLRNDFDDNLNLLYARDHLSRIRGGLGKAIIARQFIGRGYGDFAADGQGEV